jgi:hypothetical protein
MVQCLNFVYISSSAFCNGRQLIFSFRCAKPSLDPKLCENRLSCSYKKPSDGNKALSAVAFHSSFFRLGYLRWISARSLESMNLGPASACRCSHQVGRSTTISFIALAPCADDVWPHGWRRRAVQLAQDRRETVAAYGIGYFFGRSTCIRKTIKAHGNDAPMANLLEAYGLSSGRVPL